MIRIAMLAAASIAGLIVLAPASVAQDRSVNGEFLLTQACGWYAIVGCSRTWEAAKSGAARWGRVLSNLLIAANGTVLSRCHFRVYPARAKAEFLRF